MMDKVKRAAAPDQARFSAETGGESPQTIPILTPLPHRRAGWCSAVLDDASFGRGCFLAKPVIAMQVCLLKSKIHRATVTGGNVDYEGSLTIAADLMAKV